MENKKQGCLAGSALIVASDQVLGRWLSRQLNLAHGVAEVSVASEVRQAQELLSHSPPDLILIDICTQSFDSVLALIKEFKRLQPSRRCIVTTLYDDTDELLLALSAGADSYVNMNASDADFSRQLQYAVLDRPHLSPKLARRLIDEFGVQYTETSALTNDEISVLKLAASGQNLQHSAQNLALSYEGIAQTVKAIYLKRAAQQAQRVAV